jgi:hypothetical protein
MSTLTRENMAEPSKLLQSPQVVPAPIRDSPLMLCGGFAVYEGLVDDAIRNALLAEAVSISPRADECNVLLSDREQVRGGTPARRYRNGSGGALQEAFYKAPWLLDFLRGVTSPGIVPTGGRGTYSYYFRPGDYLAIHRDIVTCDVAVISCLSDVEEAPGDGGMLCLYPERLFEPLSVVRATPERGAFRLRLKPGQTIVMYGGIIPHALLPVASGQVRIVSVLCFEIPDRSLNRT